MSASARFPIGRLSHRLALERKVQTGDGGGGAAVTWETAAEMWAGVEMVSGTERFKWGGISGEADAIITIRNHTDVVPAMRFRSGTQLFEILSVLTAGPHDQYLRCHCRGRML